MKKRLALVAVMAVVVGTFAAGMYFAEEKAPPKEIVFETKNGPVTFDHAKHAERVSNDCKTCHPAVFKQEKGDLGYKAGMHKTAEAAKSSCAACHVAGGKAFESKANCAKCHAKKAA